MKREFKRIEGTPISISVYSAGRTATTLHAEGILEIIFCLKGSVRFSYAYEEFTLTAGEFISVDRDAYYLYDGKDNVCVSLMLDLSAYEEKYPYIRKILFVCEGCRQSQLTYPTSAHNRLKGIMLAILKNFKDDLKADKIRLAAEHIVELFVEEFDIWIYYANDRYISSAVLEKLRKVSVFLQENMTKKISLSDLARLLNFTEGYVSEYIRNHGIGYSNMLNYLRANASEALLLNSNKTILEISEECGFSDVKYYQAAFKKWYNLTPRQFRKQYGNQMEDSVINMSLDEVGDVVDQMLIDHYMDIFIG